VQQTQRESPEALEMNEKKKREKERDKKRCFQRNLSVRFAFIFLSSQSAGKLILFYIARRQSLCFFFLSFLQLFILFFSTKFNYA